MEDKSEYKTILKQLDGKQSISIPIVFKNNGILIAQSLDIIVRGFLKFEDFPTDEEAALKSSLEDKTTVYPVVFSSETVRISDGRCVIVLMPRSEDLFETTADVQSRADEFIDDDSIISGGVRVDEQITDPDRVPIIIKIEKDVIRKPYKISLQVTVVSVDGTSFYTQTIDRGTDPKMESKSGIKSLFKKDFSRVPSNLTISCQTDLEWIPSVNAILGNNDSSQQDILDSIANLKNETPLGTSTMYDAIIVGDRILSDTAVDSSDKNIYVFTDNEANRSLASIEEVINETNDVDGDKRVPILVANMAISDTETLSIKANRSDTKNINKLSFETGGQSVTIVDESFKDEIVGIFYRSAVGSMGYGTYEFIKDFGEEVLINNISANFTIPSSDASATWNIETSLDGYNYTKVDVLYSHTDSVSFENLLLRYIRFQIVMVTGISSALIDEYGTTPDTPSLDSISIVFNANKVAYLFLNKEVVDIPPYQISLGVDANEINNDQIKVGVAKSNAVSWVDFETESQPAVDQNGKVVIPIRFSQDVEKFEHEPLRKIDNFATKTEYGRWDQNASVIIYDKNNAIMSSSNYKVHPRDGRVVFNTALPSDYQDGDFKIGILNIGEYKVGLRLTNKTVAETLDIYGIGYEHTTGKDLLPPVSKAAPEVQLVTITNGSPSRFGIMDVTYVFFDINFDSEDKTKKEITWYINGEARGYLDNLTQWNNVDDPNDPVYINSQLQFPSIEDLNGRSIQDWAKTQTVSLIKAGDIIYAEVKVSDGQLLSEIGASSSVLVIESPPVLNSFTLKGRLSDGSLDSRISSNTDIVFDPPIEYLFFSDIGGNNVSQVIWRVNGDIFKEGFIGDAVIEPLPPITEMRVNEIAQGTLIDFGLRIGNSIDVQIIPQTGASVGESVTSPPITVQNDIPSVFNLFYLTTVFVPSNPIILLWELFDWEILAGSDVDETFQEDQTMVKVYRQNQGDADFSLVYVFNDIDNSLLEKFFVKSYTGFITTTINIESRSLTISKDIIVEGQKWYISLTPYDTIDQGLPALSDVVTITS